MLEPKIVLVGYSGHGVVVAESAKASLMNLCYYTEKESLKLNIFDLEYIGFEGDSDFKYWDENLNFILGIGDNSIRKKVAQLILSHHKAILNVIDPTANISNHINLGKGNFIAKHAVVNTLASIGDYCIINTGAIIEHDCKISSGVHVAPGACLLGNVSVGENSFIGANSVVKENTVIGKNVVVGASAVVLNDIEDNTKVVGNPARVI
ncbi:acetyltransferase [uncultured Winogradskyella sp.]|uniref:acetyltransferase n=1 Tax=uncultured Winogradskyella sp. TaxID=395353 RepID=UPI00260E1633|nr:acetyltransferase [uncultured Winogradskyella sp.]